MWLKIYRPNFATFRPTHIFRGCGIEMWLQHKYFQPLILIHGTPRSTRPLRWIASLHICICLHWGRQLWAVFIYWLFVWICARSCIFFQWLFCLLGPQFIVPCTRRRERKFKVFFSEFSKNNLTESNRQSRGENPMRGKCWGQLLNESAYIRVKLCIAKVWIVGCSFVTCFGHCNYIVFVREATRKIFSKVKKIKINYLLV